MVLLHNETQITMKSEKLKVSTGNKNLGSLSKTKSNPLAWYDYKIERMMNNMKWCSAHGHNELAFDIAELIAEYLEVRELLLTNKNK